MSTAAQQLSEWLEVTHPTLFDALFAHAQNARVNALLSRSRLRGFALYGFGQDDSFDVSSDVSDIIDQTSPTTIDVSDLGPVDIPTLSESDLQTVGSPISTSISDTSAGLPVSTDNSGQGFLQSVGSGISSAASSVANFLTSQQGLTALTNLGTAYFKLQNNAVNAQLQTQVLQAQIAKASVGQSPAPITYAMAANGQLIPVYQGGLTASTPAALMNAIQTGQSQLVTLPDGSTGYTIPTNIVGGLSTTSLNSVLPWLLLIGGGLLLVKSLSDR